MPGFLSLDAAHATLIQGTGVLACKAGVFGAGSGVALDSLFLGAYIPLNAVTAATLIVTGLKDTNNAFQPWTLNGSTTQDVWFVPPHPILNEFGGFAFQASVSGLIWVFTRAFTGPT